MRSTAVALLLVTIALAGCVSSSSVSTSNKKQLGTPDNERAAEINLQIGTDYLRKNNLVQAKEKIDKAVEQNPRNAQAQTTAGMLYERLARSEESGAAEQLRRVSVPEGQVRARRQADDRCRYQSVVSHA
jgi:type IV pilus assembly protein PilF